MRAGAVRALVAVVGLVVGLSNVVPVQARCAFIAVDPQDEFASNRGLLRHTHADILSELLAAKAVEKAMEGCRVFITAAMHPPQDCSFLTRAQASQQTVAEWFYGPSVPPLVFSVYDSVATAPSGANRSEPQGPGANTPPPANHIDPVLTHPSLMLRFDLTREVYGNCDHYRRCFFQEGPLPQECATPSSADELDDSLECGAPQPLFPPNRVMAPGGGAALSNVFLKALVRELDFHAAEDSVRQEIFFIARGFGATGVGFASLLESVMETPPSRVENMVTFRDTAPWDIQESAPASLTPDSRCMVPLTAVSPSVLSHHKCPAGDKQSANAQFFGLFMRGRGTLWREATGNVGSLEEEMRVPTGWGVDMGAEDEMGADDDACPGGEYEQTIKGQSETAVRVLARGKWPWYHPRLVYLHTCPSPLGTAPHKLNKLCQAKDGDNGGLGVDVEQEFENFLTQTPDDETLTVDIAGFPLEHTVLNTAVAIKQNVANSVVRVLAHLSPPLLPASPFPGAIPAPLPEEYVGVLPRKMTVDMALRFLALKGVEVEHGGTFALHNDGLDGWFSPELLDDDKDDNTDEETGSGVNEDENKAAVVEAPKVREMETLRVVSWDTGGTLGNPFEYTLADAPDALKTLLQRVNALTAPPRNASNTDALTVEDAFTEAMWEQLLSAMKDAAFSEAAIAGADTQGWEHFRGMSTAGFVVALGDGGEAMTAERWVVEADAATAVVEADEGVEYRPSAITCSSAALESVDEWWSAWLRFMFTAEFTVSGLADKPRKLRAWELVEEAVGLEKLGLALVSLAVYDAVVLSVLNQASPDDPLFWQSTRAQLLCGALDAPARAAAVSAILNEHYAKDVHVLLLQRVSATMAFVLQSSALAETHHVLFHRSGVRGGSLVALSKQLFTASAADVSRQLMDKAKDVQAAVYVVEATNSHRYVVASLGAHRATAVPSALHALHDLATSNPESRLVAGLATNTPPQRLPAVLAALSEAGMAQCFGEDVDTGERWTAQYHRSRLQPRMGRSQLPRRAVEDMVVFAQDTFATLPAMVVTDNTGQGMDEGLDDALVLPTLQFPSAHAIVVADLTGELKPLQRGTAHDN